MLVASSLLTNYLTDRFPLFSEGGREGGRAASACGVPVLVRAQWPIHTELPASVSPRPVSGCQALEVDPGVSQDKWFWTSWSADHGGAMTGLVSELSVLTSYLGVK